MGKVHTNLLISFFAVIKVFAFLMLTGALFQAWIPSLNKSQFGSVVLVKLNLTVALTSEIASPLGGSYLDLEFWIFLQ